MDHAAHAVPPRRVHHQPDGADIDLVVALVAEARLAKGAGDREHRVAAGDGTVDRRGVGDVALDDLGHGEPGGRDPVGLAREHADPLAGSRATTVSGPRR